MALDSGVLIHAIFPLVLVSLCFQCSGRVEGSNPSTFRHYLCRFYRLQLPSTAVPDQGCCQSHGYCGMLDSWHVFLPLESLCFCGRGEDASRQLEYQTLRKKMV